MNMICVYSYINRAYKIILNVTKLPSEWIKSGTNTCIIRSYIRLLQSFVNFIQIILDYYSRQIVLQNVLSYKVKSYHNFIVRSKPLNAMQK